jgi:hypothetical protein
MAKYSKKEKARWLSLKYFGTTDNPQDDVNPYDAVPAFLDSTVGSLRWGIGSDVRQRSKIRFSDTFRRVLELYKVELELADILTAIQDEKKTNRKVVDAWADAAKFPPKQS